jgi:heterotetrameric sarcosine oxidase gamma subunit
VSDASHVTIDAASAAHVHVVEIWDADAAARLAGSLGFPLPPPGRTAGDERLRAIRVEPMAWLLDGPQLVPVAIAETLGEGGAITAIGGGLVRVRITGPAWRALLMTDGVFDAEDPTFSAGCAAATVIAHVAVRLHVIDAEICEVFVPASFADGLIHSWSDSARTIGILGRA